ncbi:alpha/beta hydrolase family protein [Nocardia sp. NPDC020380]|uniref:alpha/beta hydrolase family protein n=1 Tax=Nocardia sp. NPDC020380 TaxID=3364309 RepID=UPI0037BAA97B
MPAGVTGPAPAVLLLAGSGPTDRNGDSKLVSGSIGTLNYLADVLARHGIASLRYDKLGTGQTGLGPFRVADLAGLSFDEFLHEAAAAANFLAAQPGIDPSGIGIVGHSEGALIAFALADGKAGPIPALRSVGLIEPPADRILDIMAKQLTAQVVQAEQQGTLSQVDGVALLASVAAIVTSLRVTGTVPSGVPQPLQQAGFTPTNAKFLATEDQLDPIALASTLSAPLRVFTSCSDHDIQIACADVARLNQALTRTTLQTVHLTTADHVLKDTGDQPSTGAEYAAPLPYSSQFTDAFGDWIDGH